jgi:alpha-beta hydrolase superfamily lysophospholipase
VSSFFVVTQDLQIFPTLISSTFGFQSTAVSAGVDQSFVMTSDGEQIDVWRISAVGDRLATTVILRGNADTLRNVSNLQRYMANRGITSYAFDYRGSGRSTGWPSESGIYRDAEAVASFAAETEKIDRSELTVFGMSIGTGPAAYLASQYQVQKLVLAAPYHDLHMLVGEMPLFGLLTPFLRYRFPTAQYVKGLSRTKVAIFHGTDDRTIPIHHSRQIVEEAPVDLRPTLTEVQGAGHSDILGRVAGRIVDALLPG